MLMMVLPRKNDEHDHIAIISPCLTVSDVMPAAILCPALAASNASGVAVRKCQDVLKSLHTFVSAHVSDQSCFCSQTAVASHNHMIAARIGLDVLWHA